jgi:hypothetical protein
VLDPDGMAMDKRSAVTLAKGNVTVLKARFASRREQVAIPGSVMPVSRVSRHKIVEWIESPAVENK